MHPESKRACILLLLVGVLLMTVAPVGAANITYGSYNRPVLFEGVQLDGVLYDVTVIWDSTYSLVYATSDPMFLGDEAGSLAAVEALSQALVADGYTTSTAQSYLNVPFTFISTYYRGWSVFLPYGPTSTQYCDTYPAIYYGSVGFTIWTPAGPVVTESTSWGRVKALFPR